MSKECLRAEEEELWGSRIYLKQQRSPLTATDPQPRAESSPTISEIVNYTVRTQEVLSADSISKQTDSAR